MSTKQHIKRITLTATTIEVNGKAQIPPSASLAINLEEFVEYYWVSGNAVMLNPLTITTTGVLNAQTVVKIIYDATMTLGVNALTILGYSVPQVFANKQMIILAKYDSDTTTWDVVVNPDLEGTSILNENKIETEIAKASKFITRSAAGAVESLLSIPAGDIVGETEPQLLTNKQLQDSTTTIVDNADNTRAVQFQVSTVSPATTRVITVLDEDMVMVGRTNTQRLTNKTLDAAILALPDIWNLAETFKYKIRPTAIGADRTVTLPLLLGNDVFVFEAFAQTLSAKIIDAASNTISNIGAGEMDNNSIIHVLTVTIDPNNVGTPYTINVRIPYNCYVDTTVNGIQCCAIVAIGGSNAVLDIQDNGANSMLGGIPITFTFGDGVGHQEYGTVVANNTFVAGESLKVVVTSNSTSGLIQLSIPLIKT